VLVLIVAFAMLTTIQIQMAGAVTATISMTFSSQIYDGYAYVTSGTYVEAWVEALGTVVNDSVTNRVGQRYYGAATYRIDRSFLYFDTSLLPDNATITSVILGLYIQGNFSTTDFNVTIQHSSTYSPHIPLESLDYYFEWYDGDGGSRNTSEITSLDRWNITLSASGISWIDVDGTTKICLRSSKDIDITAPTDDEYITFYSAEQGEAYSPKLYVTYEVEGSQLQVQSLPTNVAFTLNGTSESTPYSAALENGTYLINFSSSFARSGLTWSFSYWNDNTSNTNPIRTIDLQSNFSYSVTYTSAYASITYTGSQPVFECAMNNMFELDAISESMIGNIQRQMLLDSSAYGNHGHMYPLTSPYGGPTLTWGAMGKGLRLDGVDDTVIVPSSLSLNISEALTVEFWFSVDNGTANQIIISKPYEWQVAIINHTLYAGVYTTGGNYWIESNTTLPDGAFGFISLVYDYRYANASLYINSELDSSVATDGYPISLQNSDLYLGSYANASSYFKGVLDEVRIFPYERSEEAIYSDARAAITKFDSLNFVASSKQAGFGTEEIASEGVIDGYTGLKTNDWQLPWAYANDTYNHVAIRAASYMAGFQSYQLYCNLKFQFFLTGATWARAYTDWYWLFFRDGKLQVAYMMEVCPDTVIGATANVTKWHVRFVRSTSYYTNVTMLDYTFTSNTTLYPNSIPIIVSAWIGPDNSHFTIRFDVQDSRMITAYDGSYATPFAYSFELVDENANPHLLTWFDGWAVSGIKIFVHSVGSGTWARMEIESHKFFWIPIILVALLIFGFAMVYYSKPTELLVPVTIIHEIVTKEIITVLQPLAELIGGAVKGLGEPIVDALSLLSHDIIGAVFGLGTVFQQGLAPLGQLLLDLGAGIVDTFRASLGGMYDFLVDWILNTLPAGWQQALTVYDSFFAWLGFPGGATTTSAWLGSAWSWLVSSMTYSLSLFPVFFTFLGTFMVQLVAFIAEAFQWWGMVFTVTGSFLAGGYGTGVNIWTTYNVPQWITLGLILYPIYLVFLWEEEGLGAVIDQITFIYNSLHLMAYVFLTMIHYVSSMITRMIELIPIAE
jgi:hypothetical protein